MKVTLLVPPMATGVAPVGDAGGGRQGLRRPPPLLLAVLLAWGITRVLGRHKISLSHTKQVSGWSKLCARRCRIISARAKLRPNTHFLYVRQRYMWGPCTRRAPRLSLQCAAPATKTAQGWPKLWANFRALIGIFGQRVGPSLAIRGKLRDSAVYVKSNCTGQPCAAFVNKCTPRAGPASK